MYLCVYHCASPHVHVWRSEVDAYLPLLLSTLCFEIGWSLTEPGVCHFSKMTDHQALGMHLSPLSQYQSYRCLSPPLAFTWMLKFWTLVLIFTEQALPFWAIALSPEVFIGLSWSRMWAMEPCIRAAVCLLYISRIRYITSLWKVSHVDDPWNCIS